VTGPEESRDGGGMVSPWHGTTPEVLTAGIVVSAAAVAGYAVAGWAGLTVVAVAAAASVMVLVRTLLPQLTPDAARKAREKPRARILTGYSHRRFVVHNAMTSQNYYDHELRPVLEHLLAARLAERHAINLYQDPEKARQLLCRTPRDGGLWRWIDPSPRTTGPDRSARDGPHPGHDGRGIPRHTLARLIDRLEKL
jgi:hypothetical protein